MAMKYYCDGWTRAAFQTPDHEFLFSHLRATEDFPQFNYDWNFQKLVPVLKQW